MIFKIDHVYSISDISPNGQWLVVNKNNSNADSDLYLVELTANNPTAQHITEHSGDVQFNAYNFTPDCQHLVYGTNAHGEFNQTWLYGIENKLHSPYYTADWDVSGVGFSDNGQYRVVAVNEDALTNCTLPTYTPVKH